MRRSKYNNRKTMRDGILFDSEKEADRYSELQLLERAGLVRDIELQPEFELIPRCTIEDGTKLRRTVYRADFRYYDVDRQQVVIEDVKGIDRRTGKPVTDTALSKIKRKLVAYKYGIKVEIV